MAGNSLVQAYTSSFAVAYEHGIEHNIRLQCITMEEGSMTVYYTLENRSYGRIGQTAENADLKQVPETLHKNVYNYGYI